MYSWWGWTHIALPLPPKNVLIWLPQAVFKGARGAQHIPIGSDTTGKRGRECLGCSEQLGGITFGALAHAQQQKLRHLGSLGECRVRQHLSRGFENFSGT